MSLFDADDDDDAPAPKKKKAGLPLKAKQAATSPAVSSKKLAQKVAAKPSPKVAAKPAPVLATKRKAATVEESEEEEEEEEFDEEMGQSDDEMAVADGTEADDGLDGEEEEDDAMEDDEDENESEGEGSESDELEFERKARVTVARMATESRLNTSEQLDLASAKPETKHSMFQTSLSLFEKSLTAETRGCERLCSALASHTVPCRGVATKTNPKKQDSY